MNAFFDGEDKIRGLLLWGTMLTKTKKVHVMKEIFDKI